MTTMMRETGTQTSTCWVRRLPMLEVRVKGSGRRMRKQEGRRRTLKQGGLRRQCVEPFTVASEKNGLRLLLQALKPPVT